MAEKQINIRLNTIETKLNTSLKKIEKLEKIIDKINRKKIRFNTSAAQRAVKRLNEELTKGKGIVDDFMDTNKPNQFARKISTIKQEMGLVRKAFDDSVKATDRQRAATTLLAGNFKALRLEATAFAMASGADPSKTIGSVNARLKTIEAFPRTILAGNEAMSMLKRMQEMTIVGSEEFLKISKAIGRQLGINANIQKQAARAATPFTAATAFVTQAQTEALAGKTLVPPSRRLPEAGQTSSQFMTPTTQQVKRARQLTRESEKILQNEKKVTNEARKQQSSRKKEAHRRLRNIRKIRRGRMQGNMLGAGFPLLFGGGAGAVGGSLLGSMLAPAGQQFGAQILGSAVGTILEQNLQKVQAIGNATRIINLDALKESGIRVNAELEDAVQNLKMMNKESEAQALIAQEVADQTGTVKGTNEGIALLINSLGKEWGSFTALISTTLGILSVPFVATLTGILALVNLILKLVNRLFSEIGRLVKILSKIILGNVLFDKLVKYFENLADNTQDATKALNDYLRDIEKQELAIRRRIELGEKEAAIQQKLAETATKLGIDKDSKEYVDLDNAIRGLAALEQQEESVKRLRDLYKSLGQTIEDGVVNAIQAAIDGTKTLGDVARSVFRELQRSLIRYSVNALSRSIFSFNPMANAMGQKTSPISPGNIYGVDAAQILNGLYGLNNRNLIIDPLNASQLEELGKLNVGEGLIPSLFNQNRANGGSVKGGNDYIVGERGPELFSPGVSGMITPNHMLGGSTNVVVNVDASGSSVEGDDQRSRELGQMLSAAIQSELIKQRRPGGLLT
tara:strand:+ start:527 stop:2923 length:2397 start_codon:yes stop_codon:yes gene_type:complete